VIAYAVFTGTHLAGGPCPPTGKTAHTNYVYAMQFEAGKIAHMTKVLELARTTGLSAERRSAFRERPRAAAARRGQGEGILAPVDRQQPTSRGGVLGPAPSELVPELERHGAKAAVHGLR
jgi:hypothetical protein